MTQPRYSTRVIKISAEDSPNVRLAMQECGAYWDPESKRMVYPDERRPSGRQIVPGVLPWDEYVHRRLKWDPIRQCIGLDGVFYEGGELLMFPPQWMNRAEQIARNIVARTRIGLKNHMGVDSAEGGDKSAWCVIDKLGIKKLLAYRTPDTVAIVNQTVQLIREYDLDPRDVYFDKGGGGTQHVDRLRDQGFNVQSVAFGEAVQPPPRRVTPSVPIRKEEKEEAYAFKNRRAQMFWLIRLLIDPAENPDGFGISAEYEELRSQLAPIPLLYDGEGRIVLPPKNKRNANDKQPTLVDIIGHSPDEADALALATFSMTGRPERKKAGALL